VKLQYSTDDSTDDSHTVIKFLVLYLQNVLGDTEEGWMNCKLNRTPILFILCTK